MKRASMRILLTEIAVVERLMPLATKLKTVPAMGTVSKYVPKFSMASLACVSLPWVHVDAHRSVVYYPSVLADLPLCVECGSGGRRKS